MESPQPAPPVNRTGLPPGVEVGGLGKRFVAQLIDRLVPALIAAATAYLATRVGGRNGLLTYIVGSFLVLTWLLVVWWGFAVRAAGPGMRLMHQQLVGFYDGRPIGWMRYALRTLVFWALSITGIGLVLMLIFLLVHPRKQGWHDLAAQAVVIKQRALAPPKLKSVAEERRAPDAIAVAPQDQLTGTSSPYGGQPYPPAQPLTPPGVEPLVTGGPSGQGGQPFGDAYAAAGSQPQTSDYSSDAAGADPYQAAQSVDRPPNGPAVAAGAAAAAGAMASAPPGKAPPEAEAATTTARVRAVALPGPRDENAQTGWLAVLDDGREIPVNGLVLLGRNPQAQPGEEDAQLIKIADETRTVSKSHLAISTDADGAFVVDRGSTNGSTVTNSSGVSTRCQVGERVRVAEGSIISIGDHWLEMRRRPE